MHCTNSLRGELIIGHLSFDIGHLPFAPAASQ
jgi:hypothetical protein